MPTTHVSPDSADTLQDIADALFKARKVVVVTGAGISTNSGIPDFRSENGLYSLIQAQFDAAAQQARQREQAALEAEEASEDEDMPDVESHPEAVEDVQPTPEQQTQEVKQEKQEPELQSPTPVDTFEEGPARKRRRISADTIEVKLRTREDSTEAVLDEITVEGPEAPPSDEHDTIYVGHEGHEDTIVVTGCPSSETGTFESDDLPTVTPMRTTRRSIVVAAPMTSPLSSPPPDDALPPSGLRKRHSRLNETFIAPSSSPLSSPPPVLFDPFISSSPSDRDSSRRSSTSPSEVDETPPSSNNPFSSSQLSNLSRNTLPNMKGKDLFDASIWADPLRTSVFYTFATTLRQKIKDVEPTASHKFIRHLRDRGKLVRCYTQNIDQIEEKVGLSTSLLQGPGSRGRFSRKSTATLNQLQRMVEEASESSTPAQPEATEESSQQSEATSEKQPGTETPSTESDPTSADTKPQNPRRQLPSAGVECVFLHGSLEQLRCFLCGRVCSWDDCDREQDTLGGLQPECPHCKGATTAREERGKRALGVGKLRPDIVLYGEEHPNAHLISPIITHDLALCPDLFLILGTSLRVHGLKVMVREFAKAVHAKGGKVVFVNFTKPSESSWGDVIDYWIEWDCDAWVADLQDKIPKLWQAPEPPKPKKKRESGGASDDSEKKRPPAANPVALRDTKATGAYWTLKIVAELHKITGVEKPEPPPAPVTVSAAPTPEKKKQPRTRRPRRSAPAALERIRRAPSTLAHVNSPDQSPVPEDLPALSSIVARTDASIGSSVKTNPRNRKRRRIDGEEVQIPRVGPRPPPKETLRLPPLAPKPPSPRAFTYTKAEPVEPSSLSMLHPLATISPNLRSGASFKQEAFHLVDPMVMRLDQPPSWPPPPDKLGDSSRIPRVPRKRPGDRSLLNGPPSGKETDAAMTLAGLRAVNTGLLGLRGSMPKGIEGLSAWGGTWHHKA